MEEDQQSDKNVGTDTNVAVYFKDTKPIKVGSQDLMRKVVCNQPLFKNIYQSDSFTDLFRDEEAERKASMLLTGFVLKDLKELQDALDAKAIVEGKKTESELFPCIRSDVSSDEPDLLSRPIEPMYSVEERMKYLMDLEKYSATEAEMITVPLPTRKSSREQMMLEEQKPLSELDKAKMYLINHKIFEFFQYLSAHLLGALPENPIDYLMTLLDRILLYRSGLISPPLLYEKRHIEQFFTLMDRLGQGFVTVEQYRKAMETFAITSYNHNPIVNHHGMVTKMVFIEEIFIAEVTLFNEMIRAKVPCVCDYIPPPTVVHTDDLRSRSTTATTSSESLVLQRIGPAKKFHEKLDDKQTIYKGKFRKELRRNIEKKIEF